jgi:hypothetical protein
MSFHIGQKVVCVKLRPTGKALYPAMARRLRALRSVYTVRAIFNARPHGFDFDDAVLLGRGSRPRLSPSRRRPGVRLPTFLATATC